MLADRNQEGSAERLGSEGSRLLDELVRLVAMPPSQQLWPASVNEESLADYLKLIGCATERRMLPVLDLDPVVASAEPVRSPAVLRHQAFQPHAAGRTEQLRTDLALLERRHEDALHPAAEDLRQVVLAKVQRQLPQVVAIERQDVEGVELDVIVVFPGVALKSDTPSTFSTTASPSMMNWLLRIFSAVSAIQGYRLVQSWPPLENSRTRLPSRAFPLSTPRKIAAFALPPPNTDHA